MAKGRATSTGRKINSEVNMFGKKSEASKPKAKKLPGPDDVPPAVWGRLVSDFGKQLEWIQWNLRIVTCPREGSENICDFRCYDLAEATEKKINVRDYLSLDEHPELILYEGWMDTKARRAEFEEKRKG